MATEVIRTGLVAGARPGSIYEDTNVNDNRRRIDLVVTICREMDFVVTIQRQIDLLVTICREINLVVTVE